MKQIDGEKDSVLTWGDLSVGEVNFVSVLVKVG
jgi:hypothetical protein